MSIVLGDVEASSNDFVQSFTYTVKPWREIAPQGEIATYVNPSEGQGEDFTIMDNVIMVSHTSDVSSSA